MAGVCSLLIVLQVENMDLDGVLLPHLYIRPLILQWLFLTWHGNIRLEIGGEMK
jgi:hypothetical protein